MSVRYGFTDFTRIWLKLSRDEHLQKWPLLILCWRLCDPLLTQTIAGDAASIVIKHIRRLPRLYGRDPVCRLPGADRL